MKETPTSTSTITETMKETPTSTSTITATMKETPTSTSTITETMTETPTSTLTITETMTETPTSTSTITETMTETPTLTSTMIPMKEEFVINIQYNSNFKYKETIESAIERWEDIIGRGVNNDIVVEMELIEFDPAVYGQAIAGTYVMEYNEKKNGIITPSRAKVIFNSHPDGSYNWERLNELTKVVYDNELGMYVLRSVAYFVVLHEVGHALGIGPCWDMNGLTKESLMTGDTRYIYDGEKANEKYKEYLREAGMNDDIEGIPLEDDGGSGTEKKHPEEDEVYIHDNVVHPALNNELMTGFIGSDASSVRLSKITLGFLEDLGYEVKYEKADNFSL